MFNLASRKYILLNKILTLGRDKKWRQAATEAITPRPQSKILDACTGTADLALKIAEKFPHAEIHALDYSPDMLSIARQRQARQGLRNLVFKQGDCTRMEFESGYFDYVTVSFGFRNLSFSRDNLDKALREIYRVLKKGGRLIIIETSQPENRLIRKIFHFYAACIVPAAGTIFSGSSMPYRYLGRSIIKFFDEPRLIEILCAYGFRKVKATPFIFGMVLLCSVEKNP